MSETRRITSTEGGHHEDRRTPHQGPDSVKDRDGADGAEPRTRRAGLFDIRTFIAMLLGIYGVVLVLMGFFGTSESDIERADGANVNLWVGVGLLVAAAVFEAWRRWRPVRVPEDPQAAEAAEA